MDDVSARSSHGSEATRQPNLFSILNDEERKAFVTKCAPVTFSPGQFLFVQGNEHAYSYIVEEGLIRTYYVAPTGREITLGYWSTGDLVGGPAVLGGGVHVWSATASRTSKVLSISGPALRQFAASDPKVSEWIIDVLGFKLRWLSILFQIHGTDCVEDRLAKLLLLLAENYGEGSESGTVIKYRISQGDLGTLVGASRQWTNKSLNQLRDKGLLAIENRQIVLRNIAALKKRTQLLHG